MFSQINTAIVQLLKEAVVRKIDMEGLPEGDSEDWIDDLIQHTLNNWDYNYNNFYDSSDIDISMMLENQDVLLEMEAIVSNYFMEGFGMDWASTQNKLTPCVVSNTYAYVYVMENIDYTEMVTEIMDGFKYGFEETKN